MSVLYTPIYDVDPPSNRQTHNTAGDGSTDNVIDRNFEIGSVQELTAQPVGTMKSVLFPGELNPTGECCLLFVIIIVVFLLNVFLRRRSLN